MYPKNVRDVLPKILQFVDLSSMQGELSDEKIHKFNQFMVKHRSGATNKDEQLFKVFVANFSSNSWSLFMTLSHVIGDGHTFYKIHNMIDNSEEITSLDTVRKEYLKEAQDKLGPTNKALIYTCLMVHPTKSYKPIKLIINNNWIEQQKLQFQTENTFVSTNDIITSWFFKKCNCDIGIMSLNWRNRLKHLTDNDAGNYVGGIVFQKKDFADPTLIRKSVMSLQPCNSVTIPDYMTIFTNNSALITNWGSFCKPVTFSGCSQHSHFPVNDKEKEPWIAWPSFCVIFTLKPGVSAVLINTCFDYVKNEFINDTLACRLMDIGSIKI